MLLGPNSDSQVQCGYSVNEAILCCYIALNNGHLRRSVAGAFSFSIMEAARVPLGGT
jgi:hypothetical protein